MRNVVCLIISLVFLVSCSTTTQNAQELSANEAGSVVRSVASQDQGRECTSLKAPAGNDMEYCKVCADSENKQCRYMSRLIMGTDHFNQSSWQNDGQQVSEVRSRAVLYEAIRNGVNAFDTAPIYVGDAENRLGKWLKEFKDYVQNGTMSPDFGKWMAEAKAPVAGDSSTDLAGRQVILSWLANRNAIKAYFFQPQTLTFQGGTVTGALQTHSISKGGFPFDIYYLSCFPTGRDNVLTPQLDHSAQVINLVSPLARDSGSRMECDKGTNSWDKAAKPKDGEKFVPPGTYAARLYGDVRQIEERLSEEFENSQRNLNDDIAVYLMHRDDGDYFGFEPVPRQLTPVETIMKGIRDAGIPVSSASGNKLPRMVGWSNWATDRVNKSLELQRTLFKPVMNSAYFSLFEMKDVNPIHAGGIQVKHSEMMDPEFQKGIFQSPYSPLGGFSILDQPGKTPSELWGNAGRHARNKAESGDAYWQNVYFTIFCNDPKESEPYYGNGQVEWWQDMYRRSKTYAAKNLKPTGKDAFGNCKNRNLANEGRFIRAVKFGNDRKRADGSSHTVDQVLNAYALAHPRADFITMGPITIEQVRRTTGDAFALSKRMSAQDLEYLYSGRAQAGK